MILQNGIQGFSDPWCWALFEHLQLFSAKKLSTQQFVGKVILCRRILIFACQHNENLVRNQEREPVASKTKTYNGRVGLGQRTAGRRGRAGPGRMGRRRFGSPRGQQNFVPSKASNTHVLNISSKAQTSEILRNSVEEPSPHWTCIGGQNALFDPGC